MTKKALLFGISGQDGRPLAELLLEKGYEVYGVIRRSSSPNTKRIDHIFDRLNLEYGDITDAGLVSRIIEKIQPDEIYNLAAQSHVQVSVKNPHYTSMVNAIGTLNIIDAAYNYSRHSKIYQASTSEMFGGMEYNQPKTGYVEESPFHPRSPYGVAKLFGYWTARNYKESFDMFICNGLLFNHSSEFRGINFIEQKICQGLVKICQEKQDVLTVGNLYAKRDIGHAKDYVRGMWLMLQQEKPNDYILATGKTYSIKQMINLAAEILKMDIEWKGKGIYEKAYIVGTGRVVVQVDEKYFRPAEVDVLVGDASKAKKELGWEPTYSMEDILKEMIYAEFRNGVK